jgi:hypothetical protein
MEKQVLRFPGVDKAEAFVRQSFNRSLGHDRAFFGLCRRMST